MPFLKVTWVVRVKGVSEGQVWCDYGGGPKPTHYVLYCGHIPPTSVLFLFLSMGLYV